MDKEFVAIYHPHGNGGCIGYVYFNSNLKTKEDLERQAATEIGNGNVLLNIARLLKDESDNEEPLVFEYLNALREGGTVNMFEAPQLLMEEFYYTRDEAKQWWVKWTKTFSSK